MKTILYRLISVITFVLALLCFVSISAVEGRGLIDLSNIARYALASLAAIFAITSVVISIKLKLEKRQKEKQQNK